MCKAHLVRRSSLLRNIGRNTSRRRGSQVELHGEHVARLVVERHGERLAPKFPDTEATLVRGPHDHIAQTRMQRYLAPLVARESHDGAILPVVEYLELDRRARNRLAVSIDDRHHRLPHGSIVTDDVDLRIALRALDHILRPVIVAINTRVHQHGARRRLVEPCDVEFGLRLACTQKRPPSVDPHLNPCVVVVGMGPARRIDLTRRYAHGTHRRNREG